MTGSIVHIGGVWGLFGAAMAESGSRAHLISVSTAYVASTHQGEAKEELLSENRFTLDIDWEDEVRAARRLRDDLQAASRRPDLLNSFSKEARSEIGGAGDHLPGRGLCRWLGGRLLAGSRGPARPVEKGRGMVSPDGAR